MDAALSAEESLEHLNSSAVAGPVDGMTRVVGAVVGGREVGIGLDATRGRTDHEIEADLGASSMDWGSGILGLRTRSARLGSSRLAMGCRLMGGVPLLLCACAVSWGEESWGGDSSGCSFKHKILRRSRTCDL